jgi:hypothetical protein
MDLEGGFGDIDSDMDMGGCWLHTIDSVLTLPYKYELSGQGPGSGNGSSSEHRTRAAPASVRTGQRTVQGVDELAHATTASLQEAVVSLSCRSKKNRKRKSLQAQ